MQENRGELHCFFLSWEETDRHLPTPPRTAGAPSPARGCAAPPPYPQMQVVQKLCQEAAVALQGPAKHGQRGSDKLCANCCAAACGGGSTRGSWGQMQRRVLRRVLRTLGCTPARVGSRGSATLGCTPAQLRPARTLRILPSAAHEFESIVIRFEGDGRKRVEHCMMHSPPQHTQHAGLDRRRCIQYCLWPLVQ